MRRLFFLLLCAAVFWVPDYAEAAVEVVEIYCPSCGYRQQFLQGSGPQDEQRNLQHVIVVCERSNEIRSIRVPLMPDREVHNEPLVGRQYGTGKSKLLGGLELPKFLVPGNTCAFFPITAYLEAGICPVNGGPGIQAAIVGYR